MAAATIEFAAAARRRFAVSPAWISPPCVNHGGKVAGAAGSHGFSTLEDVDHGEQRRNRKARCWLGFIPSNGRVAESGRGVGLWVHGDLVAAARIRRLP